MTERGPGDDRDGGSALDGDAEPPAQAIQTEALTKRYGDTIAVEALDLWIPRGSVYGFLGPNGAGKTTTMRMLTTLTTPTSGSAHVAGHDVGDRDAVVEHVGYLPEEPPLHDELTGREQLEYVAGLRDVPEEAAAERIDELLERFGLSEDANRRIGAYSKGMKQKTGIIQAILHEPAVVFLDEPTSGLDPRAARTVRETIAALSEEAATTVFLSTHILSVVDELADAVGVLFDGRLVTEGSPETLKRRVESGAEGTLEDVFIEVTGGPDTVSGGPGAAGDGTGDVGGGGTGDVSGGGTGDVSGGGIGATDCGHDDGAASGDGSGTDASEAGVRTAPPDEFQSGHAQAPDGEE